MTGVALAESTARRHLEPLGRRFEHVRAVAALARTVSHRLDLETGVLLAAAWLHDIGYAPSLAHTGFHPIDGARYLRAEGFDERVIALVARHSSAQHEAREWGLQEALDEEFPPWDASHHQVLDYCDMTVGPAGERVSVDERLREILGRYPPGTAVHRAITRAAPELRSVVGIVERRLQGASQPIQLSTAPHPRT